MTKHPLFLSVVVVLRNEAARAGELLGSIGALLGGLVADHELVVVDNASDDDSVSVLRGLAGEGGLPNLQVYALTKEVDGDTAAWVGLENALGDYVAVLDPFAEDAAFLSTLLEKATGGCDVVFAANARRPARSLAYRVGAWGFDALYAWANGIHLAREAPSYRLISRRVVNFILQHPQPAIAYRHLPATGGFSRAVLSYEAAPRMTRPRRFADAVDLGVRLLVSSTKAPMRLVTWLSLFGALSNLAYSGYVIAIFVWKADVAPGWVTLSLQQSGMFFLISLVLLVLGEYLVQMVRLSTDGPPYHVAQEFTSARLTRREKLNLEETAAREPRSPRT